MNSVLLLSFLWSIAAADIYMHNPRGCNNRLDEARRERNNANRLFDSQNNNRGGYNVGKLYYYEGSVLSIEWTNQHSCGDPNNHCDMILQYMCGDNVRDGITTQTIPENRALCQNYDCNKDTRFGMHEDYDYYMDCKYRNRNKGLFSADQKLKRESAISTRQNPGGTRRGYECPEERDHYPYWHPSPWKDIAVLTNDISKCEMYQSESQNVKDRWACELSQEYMAKMKWRNYKIPNNEAECKAKNATWKKFPSHDLPAPECRESDWSRDNHLGNGKGGYANNYNWTLPDLDHENCVLRIRYNISTGDYDGWNSSVNSSMNGIKQSKLDIGEKYGMNSTLAAQRGYVFKQNPEVQLFPSFDLKLRLAINTNQYGRVFQDRSHTFAVRPRPSDLQGVNIHNLNVRGKRGNIVQVYPGVEYDFVPNSMFVKDGDYIHFQWTGSNTNPNNNDGQGKAGTDRSNVVLLKSNEWGRNYPSLLDSTNLLGLERNSLHNLALLDNRQFGGEMSELDDAGTYFDLGPKKITGSGTYHYMSTRNNNFSNRSQKGRIIISNSERIARMIGRNGGTLTFNDGQYVAFTSDALPQLQSISVELLSAEDGQKMIDDKGGRMGVGHGYASDFLVVNPQTLETDKKFKIGMKVDSSATSKIQFFRSSEDMDLKTWYKVDSSVSDGFATVETDKGGIYVARTMPDKAAIAGIVITCIIIVIVIGGSAFYFRRHPDKWQNLKTSCVNGCRSCKGKV
ncbi:protein DD3-3-like [Oculina patagonica]